jgi:hypothetical protein
MFWRFRQHSTHAEALHIFEVKVKVVSSFSKREQTLGIRRSYLGIEVQSSVEFSEEEEQINQSNAGFMEVK